MKTADNAKFWTPERTKQAADLYSSGKSASEVGRILGTTRNAVIGKMHREGVLGVYKRNRKSVPAAKPRQRASAPRAIKAPSAAASIRPLPTFGNGYRAADKIKPPPAPKPAPVLVEVPATAKHWTERAFGECSWPVAGEGADVFSCCRPLAGRWCAEHNAIGNDRAKQNVGKIAGQVSWQERQPAVSIEEIAAQTDGKRWA